MLKTIELSTSCIKPNNYNPNMMTETEFNELINEMRRLKRIPKPIVVRKNDTGFVIVDGEHSWRAAKEIGLEKVTCEIIVADDFESMHQTYKRNQHGTHNPVLLGKMFKRMKKERSLSNRALAKEMEVSEGTVRNALLYAEAAEVRNDYAFEKLSVKQLRYLNMLPEKVRDLWLNSGADILALFNAIAPEQVKPLTSKKKDDIKFWLGDYGPQEWEEGSSVEAEFLGQYHGLIEDGLLDVYFPDASPDDAESFMRLIHRVKKWHKFEREHFSPWFSKNYKELKAQWRRFVISFLKRWRTDALGHLNKIIAMILDVKNRTFLITPEEFDEIIDRGEYEHTGDLTDLVRLAVYEKHGKYLQSDSESPYLKEDAWKDKLKEIEIQEMAPDYIKASPLITHLKYALWKASGPDWIKQQLATKSYISQNPEDDIEEFLQEKERQEFLQQNESHIADRIAKMLHKKNQEARTLLTDKLANLEKKELLIIYKAIESLHEKLKHHKFLSKNEQEIKRSWGI